ncbi:MAG: hypothetical protein ACLQVN_21405 [Bryobacteraceae bacterium]
MGPEQSQFVFEIRYTANAKILDNRGRWASEIAAQMSLPHWLIVENRLDIFDENEKTRCFVGFRNSGFVANTPPTTNYFTDQCVKFAKHLMNLRDFQNPLPVERLGVRSRFLTPFNGTMEELVGRYKTRYYGVTREAEEALNGKLIDIGSALNFVDRLGNFNTFGGPMAEEQSKGFFPNGEGFPAVGLYFDIDYWVRPNKEMTAEDITKTIRQFSGESLQKQGRVTDLVLSELPHVEQVWLERQKVQGSDRPTA